MGKINIKSHKFDDCWNRIGVWSFSTEKCERLEEFVHCRNCPVFSETGHMVFERPSPIGYLTKWRNKISAVEQTNTAKINSILVFRVGVEWLAIPTTALSEVANERPIHRIPRNMNRFIAGIVNINGGVNVCYSMGELLGLKTTPYGKHNSDCRNPKRLIVINFEDRHFVFLVDEVKGIISYGDDDVVPVPATLNHEDALLLNGAIKSQGILVALFNIDKLKEKLEGVTR